MEIWTRLVLNSGVTACRGVDAAALAACLARAGAAPGQKIALVVSTYAASEEVARALLAHPQTRERFALQRVHPQPSVFRGSTLKPWC